MCDVFIYLKVFFKIACTVLVQKKGLQIRNPIGTEKLKISLLILGLSKYMIDVETNIWTEVLAYKCMCIFPSYDSEKASHRAIGQTHKRYPDLSWQTPFPLETRVLLKKRPSLGLGRQCTIWVNKTEWRFYIIIGMWTSKRVRSLDQED